jgi:class 3 adenylate cyclase
MGIVLTRALLVTDLVASTALVEAMGDVAAAALLARIDRKVRDLVVAHRGSEIDKTDGFFVLFEDVTDAVRCAVQMHDAIGQLARDAGRPIAARTGIHVGEVVLRPNAAADVERGAKPLEVEGLAKPFAARLMSLAGGGQTLLSRTARDRLGEPPDGLRVSAHGAWRFKGVSQPVEVFEVGPGEPIPLMTGEKARPDAPDRPPPATDHWGWFAVAGVVVVALIAVGWLLA